MSERPIVGKSYHVEVDSEAAFVVFTATLVGVDDVDGVPVHKFSNGVGIIGPNPDLTEVEVDVDGTRPYFASYPDLSN